MSKKNLPIKVVLQKTEDIYRNNGGGFVANCAMDSARAVAKDCCKQIISNMVL